MCITVNADKAPKSAKSVVNLRNSSIDSSWKLLLQKVPEKSSLERSNSYRQLLCLSESSFNVLKPALYLNEKGLKSPGGLFLHQKALQILHTSQKAVKSSWQLFGMAESSEKFLNTARARLMSLELSDKVSWCEQKILSIFYIFKIVFYFYFLERM